MDIESLWLDVDTMIPMGLMINELISNALKHAFTGQENGKIKIILRETDGKLKLKIRIMEKVYQILMKQEGSPLVTRSLIHLPKSLTQISIIFTKMV